VNDNSDQLLNIFGLCCHSSSLLCSLWFYGFIFFEFKHVKTRCIWSTFITIPIFELSPKPSDRL